MTDLPSNLPTLLVPDDIGQTDIDDAGVKAFIVHTPENQRLLQFRSDADSDDLQSAIALLNINTFSSEELDQARADLTAAWLTLKSQLDAVPPAVDGGLDPDPYNAVRTRLQGEVDTALQALTDAGGPL